jgi:hypothetical protein
MRLNSETDSDGNVIVKPVTGWTVAPIAEVAVLLAVQYADGQEERDQGDHKAIHLGILPRQCVELGQELIRLAGKLLDEPFPPGTRPQ